MAKPLILSLSDDFTGMMMAASMLREAGCRVGVIGNPPHGPRAALQLHEPASRVDADALAINTATREASPEEAAAAIRAIVEAILHAFPQRPLLWEKRIDTTLRGPIAAEVRALLDAAPGLQSALVVPANPRGGRVTVNGQQRVDVGVPTTAQEGGTRPVPSLHVPTLLQEGGFSVRAVADAPRAGEPVPRWRPDPGELVVFDARSEGDIRAIAEATADLWCSGALAVDTGPYLRELAALLVRDGVLPSDNDRSKGPILLIVGSRSATTVAQVDHVRHTLGSACVPIEEGAKVRGRAFPVVLATAPADISIDEALAHLRERVERGLKHLPAPPFAVVMSGGLTASSVLEHLGVDAIEPWGDLLPMVPLARIHGGPLSGAYLVTKGGLVGHPSTLLHVVTILQTLGRWTQ